MSHSGCSSSRAPGKYPVTTFTMSELQDGLVEYTSSSDSTPTKPLHDSFLLFVSDGLHNSSVGKVEVAFDQSTAVESRLDFRVESIQVGRLSAWPGS